MKKITICLASSVIAGAAVLSSCSDDNYGKVALPEPQPVSIQWSGLNVDLQRDSDWSMSRSNKWVAFTNYDEKTQYYVNWGDETLIMKVIENGAQPKTYNLKSIDFKNDGVNGTITFLDENNNRGTITYPVWEE